MSKIISELSTKVELLENNIGDNRDNDEGSGGFGHQNL
jgi:hypothetical protein